MKKAWCLILMWALVLTLAACANPGTPEETFSPYVPQEEIGEFYFYGVIEKDGTYYVAVREEYLESPKEAELRYVPLAEELSAVFQPAGVEGAWNPDQYWYASDLAYGWDNDQITMGVQFTYTMTHGYMDTLEEYNPYE